MINTSLAIIGAILLLLMLFVAKRVLVKPVRSFNTRIVDKSTERTMTYAGVFIPMTLYYVIIAEGYKVKVREPIYRLFKHGDEITVFEYSDGSYRLG
jgi:hypothetical protein